MFLYYSLPFLCSACEQDGGGRRFWRVEFRLVGVFGKYLSSKDIADDLICLREKQRVMGFLTRIDSGKRPREEVVVVGVVFLIDMDAQFAEEIRNTLWKNSLKKQIKFMEINMIIQM